MMHNVKFHNYKISFKLDNVADLGERVSELLKQPRVRVKPTISGQTYCVFSMPDSGPYVYTVFRNGHVNVTKINASKDIISSCQELRRALKLPAIGCQPKIDNITASGRIPIDGRKQYICLRTLSDRARRYQEQIGGCEGGEDVTGEIQHIRFDVMRFPSCNIRTRNNGTLLIFSTGKFVCVGSKSNFCVRALVNLLLQPLLDDFDGGREEVVKSKSKLIPKCNNVASSGAGGSANAVFTQTQNE